jgi:prepilin-type N-terminal cleavage/methylation domain-containing protein
MPRGFTLLETVLVIGLISVLFFVGLQAESVMQSVLAGRGSRQIESVLGTAAQRARNGVNGSNWGVYFAYDNTTRVASQAVIYSGVSYISRDITKDTVFSLGSLLKFSNVSLSGAGVSTGNDHDINFTYLSGTTSQYGAVTITSLGSTTIIDVPVTGIAVRR